jgi:hypothetical protein
MDIYGGIDSKERAEFERERKRQLEENEYRRKKELDSIKYRYYGGSREKMEIDREYQRQSEEDREKEVELLRRKEELKKIEEDLKLKRIQMELMGERKFFFSLLFLGLLIILIFSLFKKPLDFPELTSRVFWSLIVFAFIVLLYYIGIFDFFRNVDNAKKEYDNKIRSNKEETSYEENREKAVRVHKINKENIANKQIKSHKKGLFSRIVNSLADK